MATELTIHIGPPKTATTTVQAALAAARGPLLGAGILYPTGPHGGDLHLWAAMDLAQSCGLDFTPLPFSQSLFDNPSLYRGAWRHLVDQTLAHDGPVIWSSEGFTYLGEAGVGAVARATAGIPGRIVWVTRRTSAAIPSCYVEEARRSVVPPFEQYVRELLAALLGGQRQESDYLDAPRLIDRWAGSGMPMHTVSAEAGLSDAVVSEILRVLTGAQVPMRAGDHHNPGLSTMGVTAWQAHLARTAPRYVGATTATLDWFARAHPAVYDRATGGRLALTPDVAQLVDAAFGHEPSTSPPPLADARASLPPTAEAGAARSARAQLRDALSDTAPLTRNVPGRVTDANADASWRRAIAALPRRQRMENLRWSLIDAGCALARRRRPVQRVSARSDGPEGHAAT